MELTATRCRDEYWLSFKKALEKFMEIGSVTGD